MTKARDLADNAQNTKPKVIDAKGDLIVGTGADAASRLAVSDNGSILVADSAATTGLRYQGNFAAGKNKIINGDFSINQRAFTSSVDGHNLYFYDRWIGGAVFPAGASVTFSAQTFTAGAAPVSGYESTNFFRMVTTGVVANGNTTTQIRVSQKIEDVRTFAGQTMTVSFWAKSASGTPKVAVRIDQNFGSGGSSTVTAIAGSVTEITTSWVRYSFTVAVPSISGKTIGTSSFTEVRLFVAAGSAIPDVSGVGLQDNTFDIWGVQAENGSVATAFQTATGTLQGELAACQRYFQLVASGNEKAILNGAMYSSTTFFGIYNMKVTMRTSPTISQVTGTNYFRLFAGSGTDDFDSFSAITNTTPDQVRFDVTSGITSTIGYAAWIITQNASSFLALQAEL